MRLRIEREVGQLNFDDFVASPSVASTGVVVAGNPDLTPLQAWVYEATVERSFWKDVSLGSRFRRLRPPVPYSAVLAGSFEIGSPPWTMPTATARWKTVPS